MKERKKRRKKKKEKSAPAPLAIPVATPAAAAGIAGSAGTLFFLFSVAVAGTAGVALPLQAAYVPPPIQPELCVDVAGVAGTPGVARGDAYSGIRDTYSGALLLPLLAAVVGAASVLLSRRAQQA